MKTLRSVDSVAQSFKAKRRTKNIVTIFVVVEQQIKELCKDTMKIRQGWLA
jgi:hypothetical protein